jgi:hypothetical protein
MSCKVHRMGGNGYFATILARVEDVVTTRFATTAELAVKDVKKYHEMDLVSCPSCKESWCETL